MISDAMAALDFAAPCGVAALARGIAGESPSALDWAAKLFIDVSALKMGVLTMCAWVHRGKGCRADPVRALRGAAGVALALALARAAQDPLPARPRVALSDFPSRRSATWTTWPIGVPCPPTPRRSPSPRPWSLGPRPRRFGRDARQEGVGTAERRCVRLATVFRRGRDRRTRAVDAPQPARQ
jgi:hypothetical protein